MKPMLWKYLDTVTRQNIATILLLPRHPGAVLAHRYCGYAPLRRSLAP